MVKILPVESANGRGVKRFCKGPDAADDLDAEPPCPRGVGTDSTVGSLDIRTHSGRGSPSPPTPTCPTPQHHPQQQEKPRQRRRRLDQGHDRIQQIP